MLVLNRKKNQKILIGNSIQVEVLEINHDSVKLGIKATDDVVILKKKKKKVRPKKSNLLDQAVKIILNHQNGNYSKEQSKGIAEVLEALLRKHYERRAK
mgnify:CR=1 FL=1